MAKQADHLVHRLSRRQFLRGAAIGGAALTSGILAACGSSPTAPAGDAPTAAPTQVASEPTKIRALMWSNGPVIDENFKVRAQMFNETFKGQYDLDLQLLPYDQYWPRIDLAYGAKNPYDLYFFDVQAYGHYRAGLLSNIQPYVDLAPELLNAEEYPVALYDAWRFDGSNLYGLPENIQVLALYYNRDLFDAEGLAYPDDTWTWDDVLDAATKLTKRNGDETTQWGLDVGVMDIWWGAQTLAWAMGGGFFDKIVEPTKFQVSDEVNVQALTFLRDLIFVHKVAPTKTQRSAAAQDIGIFQTGKVAMFFDGSWAISGFQDVPFKWDMVPLPMWKDKRVSAYWLGGQVIPKDSKVIDAAFAFARWSATTYQKTMAGNHDWIPIARSARESEEMYVGQPAGLRSVLGTIEGARLGDFYSRNNQQIFSEVLLPTFDLMFLGTITPEEAAKKIDEEANALLAKG
jgi:multiple sugar transport system substrate-binding protein